MNEQDNPIPEPLDSGSDGNQVASSIKAPLLDRSLVPNVAIAITGLAATHSRAFGGEVASTLIAGATSQMALELQDAKSEISRLRDKNDKLNESLADEKVKKRVLEERIKSIYGISHLKNFVLVIGPILMSFGIDLAKADKKIIGGILILIGFSLILFSWISTPGRGDV